MILKKRGPFHKLFDRKGEDGFAIDVPTLSETAIAGGHIFIEVQSFHGSASVGIQAKNWEDWNSISPKDRKGYGKGYIVRDIDDPGKYRLRHGNSKNRVTRRHQSEDLPLYNVCVDELKWYRAEGVLTEKAFFD
ncbi:hypothetical protein F5Y13DRAFT_190791 [Hypoxylon sp. FL1857]|nr:hypothetical protein F5Y13DRAFT_190791 [Hypoxylon sp. FL1857]